MSIWCSLETIGFDDFHPDDGPNGVVLSYAGGWSNHYPVADGTVEQPSSIDLASIPPWCVPRHADETDNSRGPWLRMCVSSWEHNAREVIGRADAAVVLDEAAVRALHNQLSSWLRRHKTRSIDFPRKDKRQP